MTVRTIKVLTIGDKSLYSGPQIDIRPKIIESYKGYGFIGKFVPTDNPLIEQFQLDNGGYDLTTACTAVTKGCAHQVLIDESFSDSGNPNKIPGLKHGVMSYRMTYNNYHIVRAHCNTGSPFFLNPYGGWEATLPEVPNWYMDSEKIFASFLQLVKNNTTNPIVGELLPNPSKTSKNHIVAYDDRDNCFVSDDIWEAYNGYVHLTFVTSYIIDQWKNLHFTTAFRKSVYDTFQPIIDMAATKITKPEENIIPLPDEIRGTWVRQKQFTAEANKLKEPARLYFHHPAFEAAQAAGKDGQYNADTTDVQKKVDAEEAQGLTTVPRSLLSSAVLGIQRARANELALGTAVDGSKFMHAPIIDLDVPAMLIPSTHIGHSHLYINKPITWAAYKRILKALAAAGLVEQGFVDSAERKGFTAVRPIGVQKPTVPQNVRDVMKSLAERTRDLNRANNSINELSDAYTHSMKAANEKTIEVRNLQKQNIELHSQVNSMEKDLAALRKKLTSLEKNKATNTDSGVALTWD